MNLLSTIVRNLREFKRIISISKKPNKDEFMNIMKICALGTALIGGTGFVIQLIYQIIMGI